MLRRYSDKYLLFLVCAPWSGLGGEAWPSLSLFPGWLMEILVHHGHLAEVQGLPCPEGQRVGWKGDGGHFHLGEDCPHGQVVRTRPGSLLNGVAHA